MRYFYTLLVFIFHFTFSVAQTIQGKVTDANTAEPLIGVNIIFGDFTGTSSDINGNYKIQKSPGTYTLTFKFLGYEELKCQVTVQQGENVVLNIALENAALKIETVVVSAGKFEQKIEETTVSVEVIKPSLIESKNTTNIQTAIEQVPGVTVTDGQANIRGGSGWSYGAGTRVQVLVDDMPLISGDAGQAQWGLIATENIHQVEVIKGASSSLYGSSALNGVINIRTAYPGNEPETKVNFHHGFYDDTKKESLNWWGKRNQRIYGVDFLHKRKIINLDLVVGGFALEDEGYRYDEIIDRKRVNFSTRYKDQKIEGLSYGINGNFLFNTVGSALIWESYDQGYIPLDSSATLTAGNVFHIDPFITYVNGRNDKHYLRTRYMEVVNDNSTNDEDSGQDNQSQTYYTEYQYQKTLEKLGLNWTNGVMNELVQAKSDLFNGKNNKLNSAVFSQIDKKFFRDRLNLSVGARYEIFQLESDMNLVIENDTLNKISVSKPVFRLGANYRIGKATFLRSSWGQGYRFPSIAELFISTNIGDVYVFPNPSLVPEYGWSSEVAIRQGFQLNTFKGFIDVAAFKMMYHDMMEFSFGPWGDSGTGFLGTGLGFKSVNIGTTEVKGIELSITAQGKINSNATLNLLAGYLYNQPIVINPFDEYAKAPYENYYNSSSNNYDMTVGLEGAIDSSGIQNPAEHIQLLKYRHQHQVKLDAELITSKFTSGVSVRYNSFMENIDAIFATPFFELQAPGINESREDLSSGDLVIDYRLSKQLNKETRVSLIINNLLNTEYQSRPANLMPPRMVSIQWSIKV